MFVTCMDCEKVYSANEISGFIECPDCANSSVKEIEKQNKLAYERGKIDGKIEELKDAIKAVKSCKGKRISDSDDALNDMFDYFRTELEKLRKGSDEKES